MTYSTPLAPCMFPCSSVILPPWTWIAYDPRSPPFRLILNRKYDEATQQEAVQWLNSNVHANWGGTEILSVLEAVYKMPLAKGSSRQIVFLTDGGVGGGEEERIFDLVAGKAKQHFSSQLKDAAAATTVFSLGIGHGVHRGLVEGMAKKVRVPPGCLADSLRDHTYLYHTSLLIHHSITQCCSASLFA